METKGNIITNMSEEEVKVVFASGIYILPHSGFARCKVVNNEKQIIPPGKDWHNILWNDEEDNNKNMHDIFVKKDWINIRYDGDYDIIYKIQIKSESLARVRVYKNGNMVVPGSMTNGKIDIYGKVPLVGFFAGEHIVAQVNHDSGSPIEIVAENSFLFCERRY